MWTIVYDSVTMKPNKRAKEISSDIGYFFFLDKSNLCYVWEFSVKPASKNSPESKTLVNLIYSGEKNTTITKLINQNSNWNKGKKSLPVFEMISKGEFPIDETLLPIFKRKLISYINFKKQTEFKNEETIS